MLHWLISAASLLIAAHVVPGIEIRGIGTAFIAPIVIGLVNATIGLILKIVTFPLTFLTLGLFLLVINAILLKVAALFTPGFEVHGFLPAVAGSLVLTMLTTVLRFVVFH